MLFNDRQDAGMKLAKAVQALHLTPPGIVIGLPRGGVVVAAEVAKALHWPLDVVCPRKIGAPYNTELAIGAVTESGDLILDQEAISYLRVSESYIKEKVKEEQGIARKRSSLFRKGKGPLHLKDRTVLIVDDGMATGSTMKAAVLMCRTHRPAKLMIAVPISSQESKAELETQVDQLITLSEPPYFQSVGQFYHQFDQTTDEEVIWHLSCLS